MPFIPTPPTILLFSSRWSCRGGFSLPFISSHLHRPFNLSGCGWVGEFQKKAFSSSLPYHRLEPKWPEIIQPPPIQVLLLSHRKTFRCHCFSSTTTRLVATTLPQHNSFSELVGVSGALCPSYLPPPQFSSSPQDGVVGGGFLYHSFHLTFTAHSTFLLSAVTEGGTFRTKGFLSHFYKRET